MSARAATAGHPKRDWGHYFRWLVEANVFIVTALAILSGLIVGAILIVVTQPNVLHAWSELFTHPGTTVSVTFFTIGDAYKDLFTGSIVDPLVFGHAVRTGHGWDAALDADQRDAARGRPSCRSPASPSGSASAPECSTSEPRAR